MAANSHVADPMSGNEDKPSENPEGENESILPQKEIAVEDDKAPEEAETVDDVRFKGLIAKLDVLVARNESVIHDLKVLRVQTEALIKKHDKMKAHALEEV